MRATVCLLALATTSSLVVAHASDGKATEATWAPPALPQATSSHATERSPLDAGFAAKKTGPGTRLLTTAAAIALQASSGSHGSVVDTSGTLGPPGNVGRAGDRSFLGDKSMDKGIR